MKIVFWSEYRGQTGTTMNAIVLAASIAWMGKRVLLTHSQYQGNGLEMGVLGTTQTAKERLMDSGIDSLLRLLKQEPFSRQMLEAVTIPVFEDKLVLLPGSRQPDQEIYDRSVAPRLTYCLNAVEPYYDYVFIDAGTMKGEACTEMLRKADFIVMNLCQNPMLLHKIDSEFEAKTFYLFGNYEIRSRYHSFVLTHKLHYPLKKTGWIPRSHELMDAYADGTIISLIIRKLSEESRKRECPYMKGIDVTTTKLQKLWKESLHDS